MTIRRPPHGTPVELKTCERCGRLFVRTLDPGQRWDDVAKKWVNKPKQCDCNVCIDKPISEDEDQYQVHRSYRLMGGVKI